MSYARRLVCCIAAIAMLGSVVGCGPSASPDRPKSPPTTTTTPKAGEKPAEASQHQPASGAETAAQPEIEKALSKLSPEDRALVKKQKTCPVSKAVLGGMGAPYKVTVTDKAGKTHTAFLCCSGCEDDLKKNPDKYLEEMAAAQKK